MYLKFEKIWKLREMHMRKDLLAKYVFFLVCCYRKDCVHEVCKRGRPARELTWYDGGPPISYFPLPQPDPEKPYGGASCNKCSGTCNGHYLKPEVLFKVESKGPTTGNQIKPTSANPPSDVILATFKKYKKVPSSEIIQETTEKVLLSVEEMKMWFEHLHQISVNRAEGARKAAETRKRKKANAHAKPANFPNHTPNDND